MSLITRCPACTTMFKVVTDQLKVSNGWVRCGQCADVFDASAHLQVLPGAPASLVPESAPSVSMPVTALPADSVQPDTVEEAIAPSASSSPGKASDSEADLPSPSLTLREPETVWTPGATFADRLRGSVLGRKQPVRHISDHGPDSELSEFDPVGWKLKMMAGSEAATTPGAQEGDRLASGSGPQGNNAGLVRSTSTENVTAGPRTDSAIDDDDDDSSEVPWDADQDVSFVAQARRQAFWRRPPVRMALGANALVLAGLLAAQFTWHQRDRLALIEPRLKPALQAMCAALGCTLEPLKQIDALLIDSSTFSRAGEDSYRLSFSLKNAGSLAVAMPALEVTLTDTQEQPLVRRVVSPEEFGASGKLLPGGESFAATIGLLVAPPDIPGSAGSATTAGSFRVAGYRVLAFYP